jgi:hypothetical protein
MSDTITMRAGWSRTRDVLPPAVRARQMAEELREAEQERRRAAQIEAMRERNLVLAMDAAAQRGELVSVSETHRTQGANIGHTRAEFIALKSAEQDQADAIARSPRTPRNATPRRR